MLRYQNKPPKPRRQKPVTKAIAQQRRSENLYRRTRMAFTIFYGLAAAVIFCTALAKSPGTGQTPEVGDMLPISTAATANGAILAEVPARVLFGPWARPGRGCWLDEALMRKPGGTLTVLAVRPDGVMLSWAGGKTATVAACPAPGQFLVSQADYQSLMQIGIPRRPTLMR